MPVSLERLIQEVEPNVITTQLIRDCIQVRTRTRTNAHERSTRAGLHAQCADVHACLQCAWLHVRWTGS